jgi:hypothetical protein
MSQDNAFIIGTTHHICQDYSIGGMIPSNSNELYTIVCDGCSSSPYSDFGSRILSVGVKEELIRLSQAATENWDFDPKNCINFAQPIIEQIGLPKESLDATIIAASVNESGGFVLNYGDGVIAIADNHGYIYIISVEYTDNYPFYLNYILDEKRLDHWEDKHDKRKVTVSIIRPEEDWEILDEDMKILTSKDYNGIHIRNERQRTFVYLDNTKQEIEYVAVLSDGIRSFYELKNTETSRTSVPLNYHIALNDLLSFKNFNGEFVQRRLNRFVKDCQKKNWYNSDDLSLGVIYLG